MSLVIASNEIQSNTVRGSSFQAPFSWSNHLDQPLVIKAGSEVAVSSLKINKDGTITLNAHNKFYVYWGKKLSDTVAIEDTSSAIHIADLGITSPTDMTVETLATKIQAGLNEALPTPETFGMATCEVVRNAEKTDFLGFKMSFTTREPETVSSIPQNWVNLFARSEPLSGLTFNSASNTLTPKTAYTALHSLSRYNIATATDTPLCLNGGIFQVDLSNAGKTAWAVGLRRCIGVEGEPTPNDYDPSQSTLAYSEHYADFVVHAVQDSIGTAGNNFKIKVHSSVYDGTAFDGTEYYSTMREVVYHNASAGSDFSAEYNWSTNGSGIDTLIMQVINEEISVILTGGGKTYTLVSTVPVYKKVISGITETIRFPPVRDTCRNLYPVCFCQNNASNNSSLKIDKWLGRNITNFTYASPLNDWWGYINTYDLTQTLARPVEARPQFDVSSKQDPIVQPTYLGRNASDWFTDNDFSVVLRPNASYTDSGLANADRLLGFDGVNLLENASKSGSNQEISSYTSTNVPELKSTSSLFVRLNNIPVKSYNAGQSRRSQIIYSAPRFSSGTDQSVGSLFFEAPEKTYISCDNVADINLNQVDIDIVNEDETLADDLLGKTVCTLHFREKKV